MAVKCPPTIREVLLDPAGKTWLVAKSLGSFRQFIQEKFK